MLAGAAAVAQQARTTTSPTGAERMGARLRGVFEGNDFRADPNKAAERIGYYRRLLQGSLKIGERATVEMELANEQLRVGDSLGSIATLEGLQKELGAQHTAMPAQAEDQLHRELAIAYLRLGEQENCLGVPVAAMEAPAGSAAAMGGMSAGAEAGMAQAMKEHSPLACLYPLSPKAAHAKRRGAEGAVREYTELLKRKPDSQLYRWLLNIAYQQLGRKQDVPAQWAVPNGLTDAEYDVGYFANVAMPAGIDVATRSGGVLVEDFDGDGLLDILLSSVGPLDAMHFFHNNGDGTFADRTEQAGLKGETGGLNLVETDYNNDGRPDVLVLRGAWWGKFGCYPPSLLRNEGGGRFTDVTEEAGLLEDTAHPTQTAAWADYDGDGWLDLFLAHESRPDDPHPSELFHNNRDGTFTRVAAEDSGIPANLGFVKGVAWGDYNRDGRPDLYVAAMSGRSYLFRNDGAAAGGPADGMHWKFTDVTEKAGLGGYRNSFPTWFFDYDNDGWPDIFAGGYSSASMEDVGDFQMGKPTRGSMPHLFHNNHDGTFTDVSHAMRIDRALLAMGSSFGDLDNDGYLDVYLGTGEPSYESLLPNRMFRNNEGKGFQDVTTSGDFGNLQHGHGVAFADIENNGNEDVFEEMGGAYPGDVYWDSLYRNPGHGNHWITVVLEGVETNRMGYGARIEVVIREGGRRRVIYRDAGSVASFGGNPARQHIGVGKAAVVEQVTVRWPVSGKVDVMKGVAVDRNYRLKEGSGKLEEVRWKEFEIGKGRKG